MRRNSYICEYIYNHPNTWRRDLTSEPYCLTIKDSDYLSIFSYSLIKSDFSEPIVREARGIIIDTINVNVVCRGFNKFFNYGEQYADEIDWTSAKVTEKIDGSIVKLWYNHTNNDWELSSNNMIYAEEVLDKAQIHSFYWLFMTKLYEIFNHSADEVSDFLLNLNTYNTYIFELTTPTNRIVIDYPLDLYHLATIENSTGKELNYNLGIQKPIEYKFHSLDECICAANEINAGMRGSEIKHEGFVVSDKYGHRIKVKSPAYFEAHRAFDMLTDDYIVDLIRKNDYEEYLSYFPAHKEAFAPWIDAYNYYMNCAKEIIEITYAIAPSCKERKRFAILNRNYPYPDIGFKAYDKWLNKEEFSSYEWITSLRLPRLVNILKEIKDKEKGN